MTIKILNQESELASFPITQSLFLISSTTVEESTLDKTVVLFRLQSDNQLISLAEPYSYTLGYIKETFDIVPLSFKVEEESGSYKITCKPTQPLNLNSKYCIYISDQFSEKVIDVTKSNSKSNSNIQVKLNKLSNINIDHTILIEETSSLSGGRNVVKVSIDGVSQLVDIRKKPKVYINDLEITLQDTVYIQGELFTISMLTAQVIGEDFQYVFHTVTSDTITPISNAASSTLISNADILTYYQNLNKNKTPTRLSVVPTYIGPNLFSVKLPEGYTIEKEFVIKLGVAFGNYALESIKLYDSTHKYVLNVSLDDFTEEILFELLYSIDPSQTTQLVVNYDTELNITVGG